MNEFQRTRSILAEGIRERLHPGAQIYVSRDDATLLDEAFGEARDGVPMRTDSILAWFSAGKPVTAVAMAQLVERGRAKWETPVAEIIPEFGQRGKQDITLRHLLTHTAGLRRADDVEDSLSWDEKIAWICSLPADTEWAPGARAGYQSSGTWHVLGEVVRRLSGTAVEEFARANVFSPAGMNHSSLALRREEIRTFGDRMAFVYDTSGEAPRPKQEWNSDEGMTRCRPGGSARGPVRELGKFYETLLAGGGTLLRPGTVHTLITRQRTGMLDETFQFAMDWGLGFIINSNRNGFQMPYGYGRYASGDSFGHSGNQISCAFADPDHGLVVAWVCNGMPGERKHQKRQRALNNAIYEDLGLAGPSDS